MAAPQQIESPSQNADIFSMYITRVQKFEDEKNGENWKGGADSILVFTGLFSSTVATFIALSYPNLQQDPNLTTQSLLAQISQQLSNTTTGDASSTVGPSIQGSYVPPTSVVFINSVWFLSLVLSLTCALMATLLQQWTRRYLQIVQRKYAPLHHARIHEFFSGGARKFGISKFAELLPLFLLLSVFLFFAGLVVFAFRSNHTVAYFTVAIVGFCFLSYIAFTLMPLFFHDCPYHTPLTPVIRSFAQIISLSFLLVIYHCTKQWYNRWGTDYEGIVLSFREQIKYRTRSLSENIISRLENSAEPLSIDMYKNMLVQTVHWLNEDHELEEFVNGIPGLYESEAFTHNGDTQRNVGTILAALPGLMFSRKSLPWNIIQLAQRAFTSKLPQSVRQQKTRACLKALYCIPGAIRDILAPYAADEHHFSDILLLLNSPESLEVIEEMWDTSDDDVALSVRCAAAVVTAFMIIPPGRMLDNFSTLNADSIWDEDVGKKFLSKRLGDGASSDGGVGPGFHPRSDSGRLQNIVRFLSDIKYLLQDMNTRWWASDNAESIRRERRSLFETRHAEVYRTGHGRFDQERNRESPAFVPAAQQDLIVLTLEILARDPVAIVATPRNDAFREAYKQFKKVALTRALIQAQALMWAQTQAPPHSQADYETRARIRAQAADSSDMVKRALGPVLQSLGLEAVEMPPLQGDTSPPHILVQAVPDTAATTVRPNDAPVPEHAAPAQQSPPPGQVEAIPSLLYSIASSSAFGQADAVESGDSPV